MTPMIKQLLLFKFKANVEHAKIDLFFENYKKLEKLDCLDTVSYGKNTSKEGFDKGYQYGAVATFASKADVSKFLKHQRHIELVEKHLNPLLDDFILVEYKNL